MKKKKWRDVKNALVMVVVMAAMMSTATYAWFTLTSTATVTGMQMTAGGSSGLQVSLDRTNWADAIDLAEGLAEGTEPNQIMHQVTINPADTTAVEFYTPVYTGDDQVNSVSKIANSDIPTYVATYNYFIRSVDDEVDVAITTATSSTATDGSFIRAVDEDDSNSATRAVRVGIVVDGKMTVFEPNYEAGVNTSEHKAGGTYNSTGTYTATVTAAEGTGVISDGRGADDNTSTTLFTTVSGEGKPVTMYVWIEGTDDDCVDEIKADELIGQIQFTTVTAP